MKQFWKILKFEFKNYLTNKVFVGVTVFFMVAIIAVMCFPRVISLFESDEVTEPTPDDTPLTVMLLGGDYASTAKDSFAVAFPDYNVTVTADTTEQIKEKIVKGEAECAFVINTLLDFKYYVNNLSMYDTNASVAGAVLTELYRTIAMVQGGLDAEVIQQILTATPVYEIEKLGKDQMQNFFYTYIMIFALYMVILLYGQMVASNVATEKSSRAMELLVTSAKPTSMMFGKVISSCLAGLLQLVCIFGTSLIFYQLNEKYWGENEIISSIFNMPIDLFFYMLLFFVLGFLVYAFLYGAIGSTASKLEDINTSVMPLTMLFLVGFFVVIFSMSSGDVDNMVMKICSYIPFTSPMAMFTRIAMSVVAWYEILISVVILAISVIGVGFISAKIYRVGVLLYGTPPRLSAIIDAVRKS